MSAKGLHFSDAFQGGNMTNQIIQSADLSFINRSLSNISNELAALTTTATNIGLVVSNNMDELAELKRRLADFELHYERTTEIELAETRLIKVRQQLTEKFGHNAEIRRAATGVLQASDINIVRQETINTITEEFMLLSPGYWLAPALVSLSAWLQDNRTVAERALAEALRRDDEKTSLFFALVCHRSRRAVAFSTWLDRYLGQQNPLQLKRQTIVLVDAVAAGVFSAEAQGRCHKRFQAWIDTLASGDVLVEDQRQQWRDALEFRIPSAAQSARYPHLAATSTSWPALEIALNRASVNSDVLTYLKGIFETPLPSPLKLADAVDMQLDHLVTDHDTQELPLRREEALLEAIIAEGGRKDVAQTKFNLEHDALEAQVSFTQLLTNAAMHPEKSGATLASQRLAIAYSHTWLHDAYSDLTVATRQGVPASINVTVDGWTGETKDGSEEEVLTADLGAFVTARMNEAVSAIKLQPLHWIAAAIGGVMLCTLAMGKIVIALIGLLILGWVFLEYKGVDKKRKAVQSAFDDRRKTMVSALLACLGEVVEWRRDFAARDKQSDATLSYIGGIAVDSQMARPADGSRRLALDPA
jgi:hypothetical protein